MCIRDSYWAIIASTKTPSQLTSSNGLWFAVGLDQIPDAIAIPTEALVPEMGVDKVFLYKGGKAHAAEVKTGLRTDSSIQIIDGLNVGDTLITSGTLQLREGLPVKLDTVE